MGLGHPGWLCNLIIGDFSCFRPNGVVGDFSLSNPYGVRAFGEYTAYEVWLWVQCGKSIKCFQSDRGGKYMGNEFINHLRQQGTTRRLTVHDSLQSNGIAECCNGFLLEHVRALLTDSVLPKFLWKEALKFAMWI